MGRAREEHERKGIRVKNVYRRAGSSGVETEQFRTSCTFVDEKDEPTHTQSSETFAGSAYPSFGKAFLSILSCPGNQAMISDPAMLAWKCNYRESPVENVPLTLEHLRNIEKYNILLVFGWFKYIFIKFEWCIVLLY